MIESEILKALAAIALLSIGASMKFAFDRWGVQLGLSREQSRDERKATDGKIERVDSHARSELTRIERDLGNRVSANERRLDVLTERIENLPTADDFQALDQRLAAISREVAGVVSKVEGVGLTTKTILDHILAGERR